MTIILLTALMAAAGQAAALSYPEPVDFQTVYVALLVRGPNASQGTPAEQQARQKAHLAHLESLGHAGHAKTAGPFEGNQDLRGIVMLTASSLEEARRLTEADPAVKAGAMRVDLLTMTVPANWFTLGPVPDNYKMRQHVLAFLDAPGSAPPLEPAEAAPLQQAHLGKLYALRQQGRLAYAGPFTDGGRRRGLAVFLTDDIDEARAWMADDPFIKAGQLVLTPYVWWSADGIMKAGG